MRKGDTVSVQVLNHGEVINRKTGLVYSVGKVYTTVRVGNYMRRFYVENGLEVGVNPDFARKVVEE